MLHWTYENYDKDTKIIEIIKKISKWMILLENKTFQKKLQKVKDF